MNELDKNKIFQTNNLPLAVSVLCLGFQIISLNKENPKRAIFVFQKTEKLEQAISDFYNDKLLISPRRFFDTQKMLKSRIYE